MIFVCVSFSFVVGMQRQEETMTGYDVVCPSYCSWARVGRCTSQLLQLGPRRVPPARLLARRGFPPPGDELCVELCSNHWSTGLVLPPFGRAACCARVPRRTIIGYGVVCPSYCSWARVGRCASQLMQLGPRRVPPARLPAPRGFPPPGDEICVELCSDHWSTGLVPSALWLCGVLCTGAHAKRRRLG